MNNVISDFGLKPADRFVVPKSQLRIIEHHALYLGQNQDGTHLIEENKHGSGVRIVTAEEFFKDVIEITRIEKFTGSNIERKLAIQNALQKQGKPYDLINYNCQHFANEIQYGKVVSEQVDLFFKRIAVVVVALLILMFVDSLLND